MKFLVQNVEIELFKVVWLGRDDQVGRAPKGNKLCPCDGIVSPRKVVFIKDPWEGHEVGPWIEPITEDAKETY